MFKSTQILTLPEDFQWAPFILNNTLLILKATSWKTTAVLSTWLPDANTQSATSQKAELKALSKSAGGFSSDPNTGITIMVPTERCEPSNLLKSVS